MSQRKALIASVALTLVLALTAIGIRAAFIDSPNTSAGQETGVTLVAPGSYEDEDDYDEEEGDDEDYTTTWDDESDDEDDDDHEEEHEDEEDHEDDEH